MTAILFGIVDEKNLRFSWSKKASVYHFDDDVGHEGKRQKMAAVLPDDQPDAFGIV